MKVLLGSLKEVDGMDELLQSIALYRKKEVTLADEQVCKNEALLFVENLLVLFFFNSLSLPYD